jgi:hypothetical protein
MSVQHRMLQQQRCAGKHTHQNKLPAVVAVPSLQASSWRHSTGSSNASQQPQQQLQLVCRAVSAAAGGAAPGSEVDQTLNPRVASLRVSKTMALTDLARSMKESGIDVSAVCVLARGGGGG